MSSPKRVRSNKGIARENERKESPGNVNIEDLDEISKHEEIPGDSFDLGSFCLTDEGANKPKVQFKNGGSSESQSQRNPDTFRMQLRAINFKQIVNKESLLSHNQGFLNQ